MKGFLFALLVLFIYIVLSTVPFFLSDFILADERLRDWYYLFKPLVYLTFFVLVRFILFQSKFTGMGTFRKNAKIIPLLVILSILIRFWTDGIHYLAKFIKIQHIDPFDFTGIPISYFYFHGLTTIILIPIIEELVFRGIILEDLLKRNYDRILAIVLSSTLFAIIHIQPLEIVNSLPNVLGAFCFGCVAGLIYQRTRNLYFVIFLHWIANLYGFLFSDIYFAEYWNTIINLGSIFYLILIIVSLVLTYLILGWFFRKVKK